MSWPDAPKIVNISKYKMMISTSILNIINESFHSKMNNCCKIILLQLENNLDFDCTLTLRTQKVKYIIVTTIKEGI